MLDTILALLGDIHKQQIFPKRKNTHMLAAYSGSLIQQNYGESILGHGLLVWSLNEDSKSHNVYPINVPNKYGYVKVTIENGVWMCDTMRLEELVLRKEFPHHLKIRIFGHYSDTEKKQLISILFGRKYTLDECVLKDDTTHTQSSDYSTDDFWICI